VAEICPRCGLREIEPTASAGWCASCVVEDIRERYGAKQRAVTLKRREAWSERSQAAWDRDRQRVSRLKKHVTPKQPASSEDPWEVAYQGLHDVAVVVSWFKGRGVRHEQLERLEQIREALRRLAWGPDDEPSTANVG
jgi:hypothetical protein